MTKSKLPNLFVQNFLFFQFTLCLIISTIFIFTIISIIKFKILNFYYSSELLLYFSSSADREFCPRFVSTKGRLYIEESILLQQEEIEKVLQENTCRRSKGLQPVIKKNPTLLIQIEYFAQPNIINLKFLINSKKFLKVKPLKCAILWHILKIQS